MPSIPAFALDPDENPGEPLETPFDEACRQLDDHKTTVYRLIRIGALRSFLDDRGKRWVTTRSIKRLLHYRRERAAKTWQRKPSKPEQHVTVPYRQYRETLSSKRRRRLPALREAAVPTEND
jgi:hypothetical protein